MAKKRYVATKKVTVHSAGTLHLLGGMTGPVLTPFPCDVEKIYSMIVTKVDVREKLNNGQIIKLTLENYNTDNNVVQRANEHVNEETQHEGIKGEVLVEETTDVKVSDPQQKHNNNYQKNKNYRK